MGIFVAFIGIATAIIIGYQVVNALEVKSDLRSMRSDIDNQLSKWNALVNELNKKHTELSNNVDTIYASVREGIAILDSLRISSESGNVSRELQAFCKMHEALLYGLDYNSKNYEYILSKLYEFAKSITTHSFGVGFCNRNGSLYYNSPDDPNYQKKLTDVINSDILPPIQEIETQIKKHKNFASVSLLYTDLMKRFYKRVEVASSRSFSKDTNEIDDF